jgi:guanine deaminase
MAASAPVKATLYVGAFVHSTSLKELELQERGVIGVDDKGVIAFVERNVEDVSRIKEKYADFKAAEIVEVKDGFFFPGFIGTYLRPQHL